jgi:general stress protein YciG
VEEFFRSTNRVPAPTENIFLSSFVSATYKEFVVRALQPECFRARRVRDLGAGCPGQEDTVAKEDRGFASMDRAKQREIASKGGKAAHQKGTAHEWTSEEAREAGRKGGMASHRRKQQQQPGEGGSELEDPRGAETEGAVTDIPGQ